MDDARRDEKSVVHVAAAAVIPPTVIAHLGFPTGKAYGSLASCPRQKKESMISAVLLTPQNKVTQPSNKSPQQEEKLQRILVIDVSFSS